MHLKHLLCAILINLPPPLLLEHIISKLGFKSIVQLLVGNLGWKKSL